MVAEPVPFNPSIGVHVSAADPLTKAGIVSQLRSAQGFVVSQRITDGRETPTCASVTTSAWRRRDWLRVVNRLNGLLPANHADAEACVPDGRAAVDGNSDNLLAFADLFLVFLDSP